MGGSTLSFRPQRVFAWPGLEVHRHRLPMPFQRRIASSNDNHIDGLAMLVPHRHVASDVLFDSQPLVDGPAWLFVYQPHPAFGRPIGGAR